MAEESLFPSALACSSSEDGAQAFEPKRDSSQQSAAQNDGKKKAALKWDSDRSLLAVRLAGAAR